MKILIILKHVAGMCQQATVSLDSLSGFAPHRELPEELTVVYSGQQHFWVSIPYVDFLHFMDNLDSVIRRGNENGQHVQMVVAPTIPCSRKAIEMSARPSRRDEEAWSPGRHR
mgnify:CR=1 FL=1